MIDAVLRRLLAERSPVALAQAVQNRTVPALALLRLGALLDAFDAREELGESALRLLRDEIAFRIFIHGSRRLDAPRARRFFASAFPASDPVHAWLASRPAPQPERESIEAFEREHVAALGRLDGTRSTAAPAATRAASALAFGVGARFVVPVVTSFPQAFAPMLRGLVLRPELDVRIASDEPQAVLFPRDRAIGRRFRAAAETAQALASGITGEARFYRVSLRAQPLPLRLDGPSAGLAIFAATALAARHRNAPPPWIGFSGAFDARGELLGSGDARRKVAAAVAGGLRAIFLPESARAALAGRALPLEVVFLPPLRPEALFERIEKEIAALAPGFLRLGEVEARLIYARGERRFTDGQHDAEAEFDFLERALRGRGDESDALATLWPAALARRGRCRSRRGDVAGAARDFADAEARLGELLAARRVEREGREVLSELGVYRAINLIDYRDFEGALASATACLERMNADPYATNHLLARGYGSRALVLYCSAKTLEAGAERERLFDEAARMLDEDMRLVQAFEKPRVRGYQGTLALYRGAAREAAAIFREILAHRDVRASTANPNLRWAREGLAHALYLLGDRAALEEAAEVASATVDVGIDKEIIGRNLRWKGAALRDLGRRDEARAALEAAREALWRAPAGQPKNLVSVPVVIELAILESAAGRPVEAVRIARAAVELCRGFEGAPLVAHLEPTVASLETFAASPLDPGPLRRALARLIP